MPIIHDDVDRRHGAQLILAEHFIAVDGPVYGAPNAIVIRGDGENLDLVDYPLHAFDVFNGILGVGLQRRIDHLADQGHGPTRGNLVTEVVENTVKGKQHQLVTDFFGDPFQAPLT